MKKLNKESRAWLVDYLMKLPPQFTTIASAMRERMESLSDAELFGAYWHFEQGAQAGRESGARYRKSSMQTQTERKRAVAEVNRKAVRAFVLEVFEGSPEVAAWGHFDIAFQTYLSQCASNDQPQTVIDSFPAVARHGERHDAFKSRKGWTHPRYVVIVGRKPYSLRTLMDDVLPQILEEWRKTGGRK